MSLSQTPNTPPTTHTNMVINGKTLSVLTSYICPISQSLMENPMMTRSGQNFERSSIMKWLDAGNEVCPITSQPLSYSGLLLNHNLKAQIQIWKENNGISSAEEYDQEEGTAYREVVASFTLSKDKQADIIENSHTTLRMAHLLSLSSEAKQLQQGKESSPASTPTMKLRKSRSVVQGSKQTTRASRRGFLTRILTAAQREIDAE